MTNERIAELRALAEKATPGPWEYRPGEHDDWGVIKGPPFRPDGFEYDLRPFIAQCRSPNLGNAELGQHRVNKTDPWEADARLIVALVNNLPTILTALEALPVMREAEQRARIEGFNEGIEAGAGALEEDARLCDCFARSEGDCACGAWSDYKTVPMERAVEIVRALAKPMKGQTDEAGEAQ